MAVVELRRIEPGLVATDRLQRAVANLNLAYAEVVGAVEDMIATGAWVDNGVRDPAHFLRLWAGLDRHEAARVERIAKGADALPLCAEQFRAGLLTAGQMDCLVRRVPTELDANLASYARFATVDQLQRITSSIPRPDDDDAARDRFHLKFGNHENGDFWLRGLLPADQGAAIEKALLTARGQLFKDANPDADDPITDSTLHRAGISWLDAFTHLAEMGLTAAGLGRSEPERTMVMIHIDADDPDRAEIHLGPVLPRSQRRLLGCDASVIAVLEREGRPIALLERQRVVDWRLRALIERRDLTCVFPGCTASRWLHIHHLIHWEDGGPTSPVNLVALCAKHHRMHHQGEFEISGDPTVPRSLEFRNRHGRLLGGPSPRPPDVPLEEALRSAEEADERWRPLPNERIDASCIAWPELN